MDTEGHQNATPNAQRIVLTFQNVFHYIIIIIRYYNNTRRLQPECSYNIIEIPVHVSLGTTTTI